MYSMLLFFHSLFRWLVLGSLVYSIFRAYTGYSRKNSFSKTDNAFRHWTATISHIQLVTGILLYSQSPVIRYFWNNSNEAIQHPDTAFFALLHIFLMLTAIVFITLGSSLSKRKKTDQAKFKTLLIWFSISLLLIFIAIPWPFSPLANRPYFR